MLCECYCFKRKKVIQPKKAGKELPKQRRLFKSSTNRLDDSLNECKLDENCECDLLVVDIDELKVPLNDNIGIHRKRLSLGKVHANLISKSKYIKISYSLIDSKEEHVNNEKTDPNEGKSVICPKCNLSKSVIEIPIQSGEDLLFTVKFNHYYYRLIYRNSNSSKNIQRTTSLSS